MPATNSTIAWRVERSYLTPREIERARCGFALEMLRLLLDDNHSMTAKERHALRQCETVLKHLQYD